MHVVLLHPALRLSGATERLLATTRAIRERGDRVTVVAGRGSREPLFAGVPLVRADLPSGPLERAFAAGRLAAELRGLEPDLLHATDERLASLLARLGRQLDVPCVLELQRPPERRLARDARHLSAVALASRTLVEAAVNRAGVPRNLVRIVEHGPDLGAEPAPRPPLAGRRARVAATGNLDERAGADVVLDACDRLLRAGHDLELALLGEGPEEPRLRAAIHERGLAERVTIAAPGTPAAPGLVGDLDVYVSLREAPDWLALEAVARGVPCIFAPASVPADLCGSDACVQLVERRDPERLARTLERMFTGHVDALARARIARERLRARDMAGAFRRGMAELHQGALARV